MKTSVEGLVELLKKKDFKRVLVGIAGKPGAGKSSVSEKLLSQLGKEDAVVVPMDGFHLSNKVLESKGLRHVKGAENTFDKDGFMWLLKRCREQEKGDVFFPVFHREMEESICAEGVVKSSTKVVIVEGLYLFYWAEVCSLFDVRVGVVVSDEDARRARLVKRRMDTSGVTEEESRQWAWGSDEKNAQVVERSIEQHSQFIIINDNE